MAKSSEQDWRAEAAKRYKEKLQKGRFKLTEGENTIRILPRVGSKKVHTPFFEYLVHREVGPNKRFVRCGKNLHGEGDCWLCDTKIPGLQESGSTAKQKLAAALQPKEQFVVQVAPVDADSGKMRPPVLWTVPTGGARSLSARLLGVLKSTKRDYVDPEKGYNLTIERTGTSMTDTIYGQIVPDEESSEVPEKIMKLAKPFSAYVPPYSEEQQKAAYFGRDEQAVPEEEEEEEEDRKKKKGKSHDEEEEETEEVEEEEEPKKKKGKSEDEEEEEEPEEDEEEGERPKKKKKSEDEEEEEPEEDEEEEEEEPKKKKGKKSEDEEEEEEPEEEEEEETPKKKGKKYEEEEEEPEEEEEEDEPKKKGKKRVEEDEEEERPKKKKKPSSDDDE